MKPAANNTNNQFIIDPILILLFATLIVAGLIMVASSSIAIAERNTGQAFFYLNRQMIAVALGLVVGLFCLVIPITFWQNNSKVIVTVAISLLVIVLIPGIGKVVNGSARWIPMGVFNLQVSEIMKFSFILYLSCYLVRKKELVQSSIKGFLMPLAVLSLTAFLLLLEPDMGAAVVIVMSSLGLMLIAGVPLISFTALTSALGLIGALLIYLEPYRLERMKSFMDPWLDPLDKGFQLTQSLMAFGRGDWFGVGLGQSLQKQFYLPEAHTDFIYAIIAEELGVVGAVFFIGLFTLLIYKLFILSTKALEQKKLFEAYLVIGFTIWMGLQAFINIGVNMGVLPTKGLTLPFISYGGSSMITMCVVASVIMRIDYEMKSKNPINIFTFMLGKTSESKKTVKPKRKTKAKQK